jgi:golgi-specific brefeldin A-resistance guanine nucleotide exchange factor 1
MSSSGYLVPPSHDPIHEKLWVETWKRLDRFLPDLRKELDMDKPRQKIQHGVSQAAPANVNEAASS